MDESCGTQEAPQGGQIGVMQSPPEFKTFIGVKLLEAKPMTRGDYNTYKGWLIPKGENGSDEGYLIKYSSTYESWSPKYVFESAYLELLEPTKISSKDIDSMIADIKTEKIDSKTVLVKTELTTGFMQYETSSCVAPENYDKKIGMSIAGKRIEDRLWFAMGFVLQWAKYGLKNSTKKI